MISDIFQSSLNKKLLFAHSANLTDSIFKQEKNNIKLQRFKEYLFEQVLPC